ncbi:MAG: DUF4401 domain-containing protein [Candidatus Azobacteroides sp.]|nr:DUF4401 domain-containing protein [Candidatus Azobacteroides sp.]
MKMKNEEHIREVIRLIGQREGKVFACDEEKTVEAYAQHYLNQPNAIIKIVSIAGGFLATIAILFLFFLSGWGESSVLLMIFGAIFIAGAIGCNLKYPDSLLSDALSLPIFLSGFFLIGYACGEQENILCMVFIVLSLASLFLIRTYILSFVSVYILVGSCLSLFFINNAYDWIFIHHSVLAGIISLFFWKEARWITHSPNFARIYNPIRSGLTVSFLVGWIATTLMRNVSIKSGAFLNPEWVWISSIVPSALILYLISKLLQLFQVKSIQKQSLIYAAAFLLLVLIAYSPALSGTILIILLSFQANYKGGFYVSILSFIYFIIQYYYDLHFTLLVKSGFLCLSGILFIVFYLLFTRSKLKVDEKI